MKIFATPTTALYQSVLANLKFASELQSETTATGTQYSQFSHGSQNFALVNLESNHHNLFTTIQELAAKLHPKKMIFVNKSPILAKGSVPPVVIGNTCLYAPGRLDIAHSPLLYESLKFSAKLQDEMKIKLNSIHPSYAKIFSSRKAYTDLKDKKWLAKNLKTSVFDTFSGECLHYSKCFGIRCAYLNIHESKDSENMICNVINSFFPS